MPLDCEVNIEKNAPVRLAHFQSFRDFISRQTFLKPKTKDQVTLAFPVRGLPHDGL